MDGPSSAPTTDSAHRRPSSDASPAAPPPWSPAAQLHDGVGTSDETFAQVHSERTDAAGGATRRVWPWVLSTAVVALVAASLLVVQWFNHTFPATNDDPLPTAQQAELGEAITAGEAAGPSDEAAATAAVEAAVAAAFDPDATPQQWTEHVHAPVSLGEQVRRVLAECPDRRVRAAQVTFSTPDFATVELAVGDTTVNGWVELVEDRWLVSAPTMSDVAASPERYCPVP